MSLQLVGCLGLILVAIVFVVVVYLAGLILGKVGLMIVIVFHTFTIGFDDGRFEDINRGIICNNVCDRGAISIGCGCISIDFGISCRLVQLSKHNLILNRNLTIL